MGVDAGLAGEADPGPTNSAASNSDRLYSRGWDEGNARRMSILAFHEASLDEPVRERQRQS